MKKPAAFALVCLLAGGEALAQSSVGLTSSDSTSVTVFGIVDVRVAYGSGDAASKLALTSGGNAPSRFGFRGLTDLGGGLAAGFWLEAGMNPDDGTGGAGNINNQPSGATPSGSFISFNRRSTVSLIDRWGELRLGRDFTALFRNRDSTDPFGTTGLGQSMPDVATIGGPTATRASNMIGYFLPPGLGGFFGEFQYFMGENIRYSPATAITPNDQGGNGYAGRIGWTNGAFGIAVAGENTKFTQTETTGEVQSVNFGTSYDFKVVRVTAGYFQDKVKSFVPVKATGYIVGAMVPFGASQFKVSYSSYGTDEVTDPRADKLAVGYVYNLSKRTAAYATVAYLRNKGTSTFALNGSLTNPGESSRGYDLGLRHSF